MYSPPCCCFQQKPQALGGCLSNVRSISLGPFGLGQLQTALHGEMVHIGAIPTTVVTCIQWVIVVGGIVVAQPPPGGLRVLEVKALFWLRMVSWVVIHQSPLLNSQHFPQIQGPVDNEVRG